MSPIINSNVVLFLTLIIVFHNKCQILMDISITNAKKNVVLVNNHSLITTMKIMEHIYRYGIWHYTNVKRMFCFSVNTLIFKASRKTSDKNKWLILNQIFIFFLFSFSSLLRLHFFFFFTFPSIFYNSKKTWMWFFFYKIKNDLYYSARKQWSQDIYTLQLYF